MRAPVGHTYGSDANFSDVPTYSWRILENYLERNKVCILQNRNPQSSHGTKSPTRSIVTVPRVQPAI